RHFTSTNAITIPHVFTLIIREKQRDEYVTEFIKAQQGRMMIKSRKIAEIFPALFHGLFTLG
ncbi:hypothetical protein KKI93_22835, partial [Xenorhabdus bovienii]|uniref:hypothetical protein n=1 Tax=Xenorhabdus bovienii TaxID=40576 RepID=UPI0023B2A8C0